MTSKTVAGRARISRDLMRGPVLSLTSQVVGLAQLALLLWRAGANEATDAYFYLFSVGMLPIQIVLVGVMYPLLLNRERFTQGALRRIRWITPLLSVLLMAGGILWLMAGGRLGAELAPIAVASVANAYIQSRLWYRAVTAEAGGNPRWISGVALPANVLGALVLLYPWSTPVQAVVAMQVALIIGNLGLLFVSLKHNVGDDVLQDAPLTRQSDGPSRGAYWFLTKSTIGYVGLTVLQSLAILLPASSLTILNVAAKIVGSVSATLVNAVLPRILHQNTRTRDGVNRFLQILASVLGVGGVSLVVTVGFIHPALTIAAICVALWVIGSSISAVSQRMAFRFLPPSASRISIAVVPLVVGLALLSSTAPAFQLLTLICAYAALDSITGTVLLKALGNTRMFLTMTFCCLALGTMWVLSLYGTI
jgi:hypothetical protein